MDLSQQLSQYKFESKSFEELLVRVGYEGMRIQSHLKQNRNSINSQVINLSLNMLKPIPDINSLQNQNTHEQVLQYQIKSPPEKPTKSPTRTNKQQNANKKVKLDKQSQKASSQFNINPQLLDPDKVDQLILNLQQWKTTSQSQTISPNTNQKEQ